MARCRLVEQFRRILNADLLPTFTKLEQSNGARRIDAKILAPANTGNSLKIICFRSRSHRARLVEEEVISRFVLINALDVR